MKNYSEFMIQEYALYYYSKITTFEGCELGYGWLLPYDGRISAHIVTMDRVKPSYVFLGMDGKATTLNRSNIRKITLSNGFVLPKKEPEGMEECIRLSRGLIQPPKEKKE